MSRVMSREQWLVRRGDMKFTKTQQAYLERVIEMEGF